MGYKLVVICRTASGHSDNCLSASLDAGADDYIIKKAPISILLSRLHAHLRRRERDLGLAAKAERRVAVGRFTLDRKARVSPCRRNVLKQDSAASIDRELRITGAKEQHKSPFGFDWLAGRIIKGDLGAEGLRRPSINLI